MTTTDFDDPSSRVGYGTCYDCIIWSVIDDYLLLETGIAPLCSKCARQRRLDAAQRIAEAESKRPASDRPL